MFSESFYYFSLHRLVSWSPSIVDHSPPPRSTPRPPTPPFPSFLSFVHLCVRYTRFYQKQLSLLTTFFRIKSEEEEERRTNRCIPILDIHSLLKGLVSLIIIIFCFLFILDELVFFFFFFGRQGVEGGAKRDNRRVRE